MYIKATSTNLMHSSEKYPYFSWTMPNIIYSNNSILEFIIE